MSYQETIEIPDMEQFAALASDVATLKAQLGAFQNLQGWLAFITDAKACGKRIDELTGMTTQAIEAKAAAGQAQVELATQTAARNAELDRREKKIQAEEEALAIQKSTVDERYSKIDEARAKIDQARRHLNSRMMAFAGLTKHPLQAEPTDEQMDNEVFGARDAHYDDVAPTVRDEAGENEEPPNLVGGSTLTRRSPRPPRPSRHDA